ncbi:MAG: hypothetical protein JNM81_03730 [Rhodospirillaceae bacterium]|nr:hypothetical protein [Rhodospirillaceae bacterium]
MKKFFIAALALALGTATLGPSAWAADDKAPPPTLKFAETTLYRVDATNFAVDNRDATPKTYPQVGHLAAFGFDAALKSWAAQRFQLTGGSVNTLRITMKEGRVTEIILPITKGIAGWFKKEESVKYEAALSLEVAIVDPAGNVLTKAESSAMATQTLIEGTKQSEKEATWVQLINRCFDSVDRELKSQLPQYMAQYIR